MKFFFAVLFGLALSIPTHAQEIYDTQAVQPQNEEAYEISLTNDEGAQIKVRNLFYNFRRTRLFTTKSVRFYLRNTGVLPIYINDIDTDGSSFWHSENCPSLLWPGQRCSVRAFFRPTSLGVKTGDIEIELTGAEDVRIHLRGRGVWPY
ncbi:hypothetical protein QJS83_04980 [Bdellovibrio sp. 22V]|uniref:Ig-like domain-containing protein n=1 Tax=Bdellovibrio sp. 22V TaxID=3044166 RepID=UPI002543B994|nr:hypothetical protein [Bdellovibrio sp. 22V]WII73225.1 hypothetical protein QJS83_04980 [Bdellovibrio sp. 22V]